MIREDIIDIPLAVVGCDFRRAPLYVREKLILNTEAQKSLFDSLKANDPEIGLVFLETCNRIEWIVSSGTPQWTLNLLNAAFISYLSTASHHQVSAVEPYQYIGLEAAEHILRVVSGLESLAAGEAQIAGQFQQAVTISQEKGYSSRILNGLSSAAGRIAKSGYRIGYRSNYRLGIHGLTVRNLEQYFGVLENKTVAVVGMGTIGRRVCNLLKDYPNITLQRFNRTVPERANWEPLTHLHRILNNLDALIFASGASTPILTSSFDVKTKNNKKLLIIDIGVPRQVSPEIANRENVIYRSVDDLIDTAKSMIVSESVKQMESAITAELNRFRQFCLARDIIELLNIIHQKRQLYIQSVIPQILSSGLEGTNGTSARRIERILKQLIRGFANDLFESFHMALDDYRSAE